MNACRSIVWFRFFIFVKPLGLSTIQQIGGGLGESSDGIPDVGAASASMVQLSKNSFQLRLLT
jgi:hypothetical protein